MPLFFHLLINDHFQVDFFNNLYILSTFNNVSLPFREVHLIEGRPQTTLLNHGQFFDVNQNLLVRALKNTFSKSSVFFISLHWTTKRLLAFKQLYMPLLFYHMCFIQRWLIGYFLKASKFDRFLCISYNTLRNTVNSLRWSVKHNTTIKTASDACFLLAKQTLCDLVR